MMIMNYLLCIFLFILPFTSFSQTIKGRVLNPQHKPIPGANVYLKNTLTGATTGVNGYFQFTTQEKGQQTLVVSYLGFETVNKNLVLDSNTMELNIIMNRDSQELEEVVFYAGKFEAGDEKRSSVLSKLDMSTSTESFGDAFGSINKLPGTGHVEEDGRIYVRGGAANETKVFVDGMVAENSFTSNIPHVPSRGAFSPMLFRGTVFSTGGYSAEYGQALSSALILKTRAMPAKNALGLTLHSAGVSLNTTKKWKTNSFSSITQYNDLEYTYDLLNSNIHWIDAPQNINQTLSFRQKTGEKGMLKTMGNYFSNKSSFLWPKPGINESDSLSSDEDNMYFVTTYNRDMGNDWNVYSGVSFNMNKQQFLINNNKTSDQKNTFHYKSAANKKFTKNLDVKFGFASYLKSFERRYKLGNQPGNYTWDFSAGLHSLFAEAKVRINKKIAVLIGGRNEYNSLSHRMYPVPRISMAYQLNRNSQVSLGYGRFNQLPQEEQLVFNNSLKMENASHYILNYQLEKNNRNIRIEAYYKNYDRLVKYDSLYAQDPSQYNNKGYGYATGLDVFFRDQQTIQNGDFLMSYSLLSSKRNFKSFDQLFIPGFVSNHSLDLLYKHYIGELNSYCGLGYTFSSGRPYFNPNKRIDNQYFTKSYNSINMNVFHFTDIFGMFTMLFAQVSNITGFNNIYGYDFSERPNAEGSYQRMALKAPSKRFFTIGLHLSLNGKPEM